MNSITNSAVKKIENAIKMLEAHPSDIMAADREKLHSLGQQLNHLYWKTFNRSNDEQSK